MNLRIPEQNKVLLVGRLTRDPELRYTPKGQPICHFDLAVNRRYKKADGEWQDETAFVPVVVWREMAERCAERLKKASPVSVEGRLTTRKWVTKEGENRSVLEVTAQRIQFLNKEDIPREEETEVDVPTGTANENTSTVSSVDHDLREDRDLRQETSGTENDVPF